MSLSVLGSHFECLKELSLRSDTTQKAAKLCVLGIPDHYLNERSKYDQT